MKKFAILACLAPVAFVMASAGCGGGGGADDLIAGDTLEPMDTAGMDTNTPEVVASAEQQAAYLRHAELITESADMTYDDLHDAWYRRGQYLETMPFAAADAEFVSEIAAAYGMDQDALDMLGRNGFVVLENGSQTTHPNLYMDIYVRDLPVLITADSILYAVHKSYDEMLKQLEEKALIGALESILAGAANGLATVCAGSTGLVAGACGDIDLYLTVAKSLLADAPATPLYPATATVRDEILEGVAGLQPEQIEMFGRPYPCPLCRYDFSQFKPRGHYTESPELKKYFKAMIWLGRTPMNLTLYDRDLIASVVLLKSLQTGGALLMWNRVDQAIKVFVGASDNMTPPQFVDVIDELAIDTDLATLPGRASDVRAALAAHGVPGSRILSQIMMMDVMSDKPTPIPAEFQLFGQRFVVDSYVFSNVVYDRITWQGGKPARYMPDPLDVAFVLGFDQALPPLRQEIDTWNYAGNLNVLRTMVDEYDAGFWTESMYNAWLAGIGALAVDQTGDDYPAAARTMAWANRAMQTGLASWAELRHDTILYVKQSYTGEACDYPDGYVEPNPAFFLAMRDFADQSRAMMDTIEFPENQYATWAARGWFSTLSVVCGRLAEIAQAQLDGTSRTSEQTEFLKGTVVNGGMCGGPGFSGWYSELFYDAQTDAFNFKPTVADVHTDPNSTDVLHVATGGANPMVMVVDLPGGPRAFVGPASSYYQFREPGFARLTDAEWLTRYAGLGGIVPRPEWTADFISEVDSTDHLTQCQ